MIRSYYISPSGNDEGAGTVDAPWRTLPVALAHIREMRQTQAGDRETVRLEMAAGRYALSETLELSPEDNDLIIEAQTAGTAFIDGGEQIVGWQETVVNGQRAWTVTLPDVKAGQWYFRSIYVDGRRAPRARYPKFSTSGEGLKNHFRIAEIRFPEKRDLFDGDCYFKPAEGDVKDWPSLIDAEVVLLHYWNEARLPQPHLDPHSGWVRCTRRSIFNLYESYWPEPYARYYIDNLYEALTEPGEWYLDRNSGVLTYLPLQDEVSPEQVTVTAPRVTRLLRARGVLFNESRAAVDPYCVKPVRNLHLKGLAFRHSDWFQPQTSFIPHDRLDLADQPLGASVQAASEVFPVIELVTATECSITDCIVEHIGMSGIGVSRGTRNCALERNEIRDIGGGGIRVWGDDLDGHPVRRTGHIRISDNSVQSVGRIFFQGTGILLGPVFNCTVSHNLIRDVFYSGISVGWSWNYRETITRNNVVEYNHIHDIGQGVLSDMGGIYMLGAQPGGIIRGNHVHHVSSQHYGGWGIYADEASSSLLIEDNLVHDTQGSAFFCHYGKELVLRNNVLIGSQREGVIGMGRSEGYVCANIHRNILTGPAPFFAYGDYRGDIESGVFISDTNLIWFEGETLPPFSTVRDGDRRERPWAEWTGALRNDRHSVFADPLFMDAANGDYRLDPDSPAFAMGFRPVGWHTCGPRK